MPKSPTQKLEDNNIGSLDCYTGEQVSDYLYGDITRRELVSLLKSRRKEMLDAVKGIDKLLVIAADCPTKVSQDEEE